MKELRYKIIYNSKLIRRAENYFQRKGITEFPTFIPAMVWDRNEVHVRGNYIGQIMLNHELIHLAQIQQMESFRDYLHKYFITEKDIPYGQKPSEVEAFLNEMDTGYIKRRFNLTPVLEDEIYEQI